MHRPLSRGLSLLILGAGMAVLSSATAAPHPAGHDDGNAINWRVTYVSALKEAATTGKSIFVLGYYENDGNSKNVAGLMKEPEVQKLINRYFVPLAINAEKNDKKENTILFPLDKIGGNTLPLVTFLTEKGQYIHGSNGPRKKEELLADIKKVLTDKNHSVAPAADANLGKQAETLQKALEAKNFKQAGPIYAAILKVRGYSANKDKAFDLMDDAQFEGVRLLKEAVQLADMNQYSDARKLIADVPKEYAGLPVANDYKEAVDSLSLLEQAFKSTQDKKVGWQGAALTKVSTVLTKYPDGAYAGVALKRKNELMPPTPPKK
jgi:hypothetical protein